MVGNTVSRQLGSLCLQKPATSTLKSWLLPRKNDLAMADGIVRRSDSPWASLLHIVPKQDGSWRPCSNYRQLNLATVHDCYLLLNIQDFSNHLAGCTIFSTIGLVKGDHQVPKTAIITPFGLSEYLFMPFGICNTTQTF
jgi:hypothetical protein